MFMIFQCGIVEAFYPAQILSHIINKLSEKRKMQMATFIKSINFKSMLVQPTRQVDHLAYQHKELKKSRFYNKAVETVNPEPKSSPFNKSNFNQRIENTSLSMIEDKVSSLNHRKDLQKQNETSNRKCSTYYSQNSSHESLEIFKVPDVRRKYKKIPQQIRKQSLAMRQNVQSQLWTTADKNKAYDKDCGEGN